MGQLGNMVWRVRHLDRIDGGCNGNTKMQNRKKENKKKKDKKKGRPVLLFSEPVVAWI